MSDTGLRSIGCLRGVLRSHVGRILRSTWHGTGQDGNGLRRGLAYSLIVVDPSHRFTGDIQDIRTGLTSSVDLSTLLVSIGNKGTRDWMQGYLADIYGGRLDMVSMLKSAQAPGRRYVLYAKG